MNKNLIKLFFGTFALVAAAAFTGCSDDDDKGTTYPVLTAAPTSVTFENVEGEESKVVTIEANCDWKVEKSDLDWATVTPESGSGSGQITIKVGEMPEGTTTRNGKINFQLSSPDWGDWDKADVTVTVKQTEGDSPIPVGDELYYEKCGTEVSKGTDGYWPYVNVFEGWSREGTLDQSSVVYGGASSSVRNSGKSYDPNADDGISGAPYVVVKTFDIDHINVGNNTNFTFTFVAQNTVSTLPDSPYTPTFGDITSTSLKFSVSIDGGATYCPVAFTASKTSSSWYSCTAPFRFPAGTSVTEINVRFDGFNGGTTLRADDFRLMEGGNGPELKPGDTPVDQSIAEVIAGTVGSTFTTQGQIVAINGRSFLIQDNTGKILVYQGWDNDTKVPVVEYDAEIGQTVKVTGATGTYSKLVQFTETGLVIEKISDGTFTQPTPEQFDGAAFEAYKNATPVIKYIEYTGTLTISGFYYNVAVAGTTLQGSLAYPADGFVDASLDGQEVVVSGYTLGMTNQSQMLSTLATSVKAAQASTDPAITGVNPSKLTFQAAGETLTVNVTTANADGCTLTATTDNNAQFTATASGLASVSVAAKENTTDAAINATLTISLMKGGSAVATKTVALTQNKKSSGSGTEETITMDLDAIKAGKTGGYGLFENSYQDKEGTQIQDLADPSTYYQWSTDGIGYAGYHICIATATDYVGTLQMQGNASDKAKQGFFGNVTDLGKITKIVVVSKNTKYEPTEHLYMGGEAYPKGNAQTRTSMTQDGQLYTETFEIDGDYGFFSIANDKQGAFYVQSVEITYVK